MRDFAPGPVGRLLIGLNDLLSIPLMALNFLAPVVGGIWLLVLGEWALLAGGIAVFLLADFVLGTLIGPLTLLGWRGRQPFSMWVAPHDVVRGIVVHGYLALVVSGWGLGAFVVCTEKAGDATIWPFLLWSYAVAAAPWDRAVLLAVRQKVDAPSFLAVFNKLGFWALAGLSFVSLPLAVGVYVGAVLIGTTVEFVFGILTVEARMRPRFF